MHNKLSYYSLALLVGLAVFSVLILAINPFGGGPASASPAAQASASTSQGIPGGSAASSGATSSHAGNSPSSALHPGGSYHSGHGHRGSGYISGVIAGNATATTTTNSVYSQND